MLCRMSGGGSGRSRELEEVRLLLFPHLSVGEGRRRVDAAPEGAADAERLERIEQLVRDGDLDAELVRRVRHLRENGG
jgi:hypothetical protein